MFESKHPGSVEKKNLNRTKKCHDCNEHVVSKGKFCRNFVAGKFHTNLAFMFSLVAWDRRQATRSEALGV